MAHAALLFWQPHPAAPQLAGAAKGTFGSPAPHKLSAPLCAACMCYLRDGMGPPEAVPLGAVREGPAPAAPHHTSHSAPKIQPTIACCVASCAAPQEVHGGLQACSPLLTCCLPCAHLSMWGPTGCRPWMAPAVRVLQQRRPHWQGPWGRHHTQSLHATQTAQCGLGTAKACTPR